VVPPEAIWTQPEAVRTLTWVHRGRTVLVAVEADGRAHVRQLLSTDPRDFLDPAWAPGAPVRLEEGVALPP
jgi:hypothetical protein